MKELKTNSDLVEDLMNFSPYGALGQIFITQAIRYYCDEVKKEKEKLLKEEEENKKNGKISLINAKSWIGVAEDVSERMDKFYKE